MNKFNDEYLEAAYQEELSDMEFYLRGMFLKGYEARLNEQKRALGMVEDEKDQ